MRYGDTGSRRSAPEGGRASASLAVVTDSPAYLPGSLVAAPGITGVPLAVVIDGVAGREGLAVTPDEVARALAARRVSVTTSRPSPAEFAEVYQRLLAEGAPGIVSVHLSEKLSGTVRSAEQAARDYP